MKSHTVYLTFHTKKRKEIIPITNEVERIIRESGIQDRRSLRCWSVATHLLL